MFNCNCNCKCNCNLFAVIGSLIVGIVAAFLQISGAIVVTPAFLWVVLGIAVVYLAVLAISVALNRRDGAFDCLCPSLNTAIVGILGAALFSVVLLGVGVPAGAVGVVLVGLLVFSLSLVISATACFVKCIASCCD